jgi:hypothetical protein
MPHRIAATVVPEPLPSLRASSAASIRIVERGNSRRISNSRPTPDNLWQANGILASSIYAEVEIPFTLPFFPQRQDRVFRRLVRGVLAFRAGFSGPSKETCSRTNDPHLSRVGLPRLGFAARLVRSCQRLGAAAFRAACAAIRMPRKYPARLCLRASTLVWYSLGSN